MKPEQAIEDLKVIRKIMSQVAPTLVMSGWQGISWGIVAIVGGFFTHFFCVAGTTSFQSSGIGLFWICLVIIGWILESFFYIWKCMRDGLPIWPPVAKHLLLGFIAMLGIGGIFHWIFAGLGNYLYIPGSWMLIIGMGCVLAGLFSVMEIWVLGLLTILSGVLAIGPFLEQSFYILAFFCGIGWIFWGIWVNRRLGG